MKPYIRQFKELGIADIGQVGGKDASLGEMYSKLSVYGISVPDGFATTSFAFEKFLVHNSLHDDLANVLLQLDKKDFSNLRDVGAKARALFLQSEIPADVRSAITGIDSISFNPDALLKGIENIVAAELRHGIHHN